MKANPIPDDHLLRVHVGKPELALIELAIIEFGRILTARDTVTYRYTPHLPA